MSLEELLREDVIDKIYYDELYLAQKCPEDLEYNEIRRELNGISKQILDVVNNENLKESFLSYLEKSSIKEGMEAKSQFRLGFTVAIKIILDSLKK